MSRSLYTSNPHIMDKLLWRVDPTPPLIVAREGPSSLRPAPTIFTLSNPPPLPFHLKCAHKPSSHLGQISMEGCPLPLSPLLEQVHLHSDQPPPHLHSLPPFDLNAHTSPVHIEEKFFGGMSNAHIPLTETRKRFTFT